MFNHSDLSDENVYKVIDLLNICIYWKDRHGTYLGGNRYWLNLLGFKERTEIIGKNDFAIFPKDKAEKIIEIDKSVIQGMPYHDEESAKLLNGEFKTAVTDKTPLLNAEGKIVGLLGISMDITPIKNKMELEKQQMMFSEDQKFVQIIDVVDASIYWKDKEGRYLGCNKCVLNMAGVNSRDEVIGKTDFELLWKEDVAKLREVDNAVLATGMPYEGEEVFMVANKAGQRITTLTVKNPLLDEQGNVIGIVGTSLDITAQKEAGKRLQEKEKQQVIFNETQKLWQIIDVVDASIYWKDKEGRYLGCNKYVLDMAGVSSRNEIIGKTDFDMLWKEDASKLREIDNLVMTTTAPYEGEETITMANRGGKQAIVLTIKNQLLDSQGSVMGIIGTSIDITDKKKAEKLLLENEKHKIVEEQQKQFRKIVHQVVHDIRSPIGSMKMILPRCKALPELERVSLNKAATRVMDIAYRLLNEVNPLLEEVENKANEPTLLSNEILEVVAEKRYEYQEKTIDFCTHISTKGYFAFLNTNASDFKRMLSNLINNAVDAIKENVGKVDVYLDVLDDQLQVIVQDNGCGMSKEIKEKILGSIFVTSGKADGHGIGFGQIRDVLESSCGKLEIESTQGVGTKVILTFLETESPDWIANQIKLCGNDIVVILDDDESIHGAWETRFQTAVPHIMRKHFEQGKEAISFINNFDRNEKEKIFLLTDYELLDQELHGLNVVKETGIARSILVTSHNNSEKVRELAKLHNTKILPKPLAAYIPIELKEHALECSSNIETTAVEQETPIKAVAKKVNFVVVEDNKTFSNNLVCFIFDDDEEVDQYFKPEDFLKNIELYSKDTKIYLDNNYDNSLLKGIDIAKELHEKGYKYLYLLTGEVFRDKKEIPSYLKVLEKSDIKGIENSKND